MTSSTPSWLAIRKSDERALDAGCWFDERAAERVRYFFSRFLRHSKGQFAGKPFELLDWEWFELVAPLFGWKRPDGTRRFRRGYCEVPKKNGKSALASGVSLYLLVGDGEPGAEVYNAAMDREQAGIVFNEAANMVEASPALAARLEVLRSTKRVVDPRGKGVLRALSADVPTKEGINWNGLVFDELHTQRTRDMFNTLRYGCAARRQPLAFYISTAGHDRNTVCWDQHVYASGILDGTVDDWQYFALIYAAGEKDDWREEATWRRANPSLGHTISLESFATDCADAQRSPVEENAFKRYRLSIWTQQETRWVALEKWDACGRHVPEEELEGELCYGGLDLASTTDVAALALWFPVHAAMRWYFWSPAEAGRRRQREGAAKYDEWVREGHMFRTDGNTIDYDAVKACVLGLPYNLKQLAVDRWNSSKLVNELMDEGVDVVAWGQGFASQNVPTKELQKLVLDGVLSHNGNPVARWMFGNMAVKSDEAGNLKPDKKRAREKIDGVVAGIMALGAAILDDNGPSAYDERGVVFA